MNWIDWCIVIVPMTLLIGMAIYSGKYARGVVDFLVGGIHDIRQLFIDLAKRVEDPDDNGQIL